MCTGQGTGLAKGPRATWEMYRTVICTRPASKKGGVGEERMVGDLSVGAVLDDGISTEGDGARERLFSRSERVQALFPVRKKNNKVGPVWRSWVTSRRCRMMAAKKDEVWRSAKGRARC
jgi:hypothetical protein